MRVLFCCVALVLLGADNEKYLAWLPETVEVATLPATSGERLAAQDLASLANGRPRLPYSDLTVAVRSEEGNVWAGSTRGLMHLAPGAQRWRLFHSRRWLPSNDVQDLALTPQGEVLVQTTAGIGKLVQRETTLTNKMAEINDALCKCHVRHGLVGGIYLKEPGKLDAGYEQFSDDNDGLWTSLYVAAEAFRYGATGDESAKKNARRSLEALMFLERVTGIPGFVARSVLPGDEPKPVIEEWHRSADDRWWWKGDTSSDEVDGHYFAYSVYYDLVADEEEKQEIRQYVERISDHILDHDLCYVGPPGKPTTWGVWAPEKLNHDLDWVDDRGLNSLEILSFLKVAEHIVGKPRYAEMSKELITKHSYHTNTVFQKHVWPVSHVNHSDDELAFLAYYPLLIHERDPSLRKVYLTSLKRSWLATRPEHSPFFNLIYGACLQANVWTDPSKRPRQALVAPAEYDQGECLAWFREVPHDTIGWTIKNSGRQDLGVVSANRFGLLCSQTVLPVSERPVMRWNGDPFLLDGGSHGYHRDDGSAILLPYWLGKYHRLTE